MSSTQVQLKISLSTQLNEFLQSRASRLGLPVTQFVKHIIIKEIESEVFPVFPVSQKTEKKAQKALKELDQSVGLDSVSEYFKSL